MRVFRITAVERSSKKWVMFCRSITECFPVCVSSVFDILVLAADILRFRVACVWLG